MHRVNVTFSDEEWKEVQRFCKKIRPYLRVGTTLKEILLQNVTDCNVPLQNVPTPSPTPACAGTDSGKEEEEKKKERKTRLAPLPVSERIVGDLNKKAGTRHVHRTTKTRELIASRLAEGFTEQDFYEVHRKKVAEWKDSQKMRSCLCPKTLYAPSHFSDYLGQLDVSTGEQMPLMPKRREQPHERRKREERERAARERA